MFEFMIRRFLYYPDRIPEDADLPPHCSDAREVWIETSNGDRVHALYWPARTGDPTILFFHGNAQTVYEWSFIREDFESIQAGLLLIDYPGYGKSTGSPSEASLYSAGLAAWEWLESKGVLSKDIILFGKSLGGGVAVETALKKSPGGLILESTFRSIPSVAKILLPMIPADALFKKERYDSIAKIGEISCPVLVIHGSRDGLIPVEEGEALYQAANPPKEIYIVPSADHNNVSLVGGKEYGRRINAWIEKISEIEEAG